MHSRSRLFVISANLAAAMLASPARGEQETTLQAISRVLYAELGVLSTAWLADFPYFKSTLEFRRLFAEMERNPGYVGLRCFVWVAQGRGSARMTLESEALGKEQLSHRSPMMTACRWGFEGKAVRARSLQAGGQLANRLRG